MALLVVAIEGLFDLTRHVLFVHVPKTGGSAVENALSAYDPWSVMLPCGRYGDSCNSGVAPVEAACQARVPMLRTLDSTGNQTIFSPLWHNQVHITDGMFRCMLDLYFPQLRVSSSFGFIRHPVDRVISSWHWTIGHETDRAAYLGTFDKYVFDPVVGLFAADVMSVPQCAFVATKSATLHCLSPSNASDRITNLFSYRSDLRESPGFLPYIETFFPGIWMSKTNTQAQNLNATEATRAIMAGDGLYRSATGTIAISRAACLTILQRYRADMELFFSLEPQANPTTNPSPPDEHGVPEGMVTVTSCTALLPTLSNSNAATTDLSAVASGPSAFTKSRAGASTKLEAALQPASN